MPHANPIKSPPCEHASSLASAATPHVRGCEECLQIGARWVHLRVCLACGHVGCCDSSPNKHATKHFHATRHPLVGSMEPGERWGWCYEDEVDFELTYEPRRETPERETPERETPERETPER